MGWYMWPKKNPPSDGVCELCGEMIRSGEKYYFLATVPTVRVVHIACELEQSDE